MGSLLSHVKIINNGHVAHVFLGGEFDAEEVTALSRDLRPLIDAPPPAVSLNLREVAYLCSGGLTPIIELRCAVERAGAEWDLVDASSITERLIELTGLAATLGLRPRDLVSRC
jgi:anti-anti-sigma factor